MIPEKFKKLCYREQSGCHYVILEGSSHVMWRDEISRITSSEVYDEEGFLKYDFIKRMLNGCEELMYLTEHPEYRQYVKNFVVKNIL